MQDFNAEVAVCFKDKISRSRVSRAFFFAMFTTGNFWKNQGLKISDVDSSCVTSFGERYQWEFASTLATSIVARRSSAISGTSIASRISFT